jgi:cyclophilin family peptidyl-prolyl cis-trans isomerase
MKITPAWFALTVAVILLLSTSCGRRSDVDDEVAVLETSYGRIVIEFLPKVAPKHVENFKELARDGFFDGTRFHRIVTDKNRRVAIQGGDPNTINGAPATWGQGQRGQKTVPAEFSKLKHERGIISAARKPDDTNSATSQFFILVGSQTSFDSQYSIFGRVIDGMNVVDSIALAPLFPKSEMPADPVVVTRAYIAKRDEVK